MSRATHRPSATSSGSPRTRSTCPKDTADEYRAQARRLARESWKATLAEHPDFSLKRMQLSGSLAKGTALRSLNDIDVAVYVSGSEAPHDIRALLDYLAERLRKAFPNFTARTRSSPRPIRSPCRSEDRASTWTWCQCTV
jgi:predicted nucleotidyltransferase